MKGSIVERGADKGKKNGKRKTFCVVIDAGRDENGKRIQKWFSGFKTKTEAEKALPELLLKIQNGMYFDNKKMTVGEFIDYWLEHYAKENVKDSTYERYTYLCKDIKTYLGNIKLDKLRPVHIQSFYTQLKKRVSGSTALKVHRVLHLAFKHAVKWQMLSINWTDSVEAPRAPKPNLSIWNLTTAKEFFEKTKQETIYLAVVLAFMTGMREGEIAALSWSSVDFEKKKITVCNGLRRNKETNSLDLKSPKTEDSKRNISLDDDTIELLKSYKAIQQINRIIFGSEYHPSDYVCTWEDGRPLDPMYICKRFHKLVRRHNMPVIRFHDLRHSHSCMLLEEGINIKVISERLGHSTINVTLDIYSHVTENMQKEAAETLKSLVAKHNITF